MRYGRALLAGMGWAAPLGAAALCALVLLAVSVALRVEGGDAGSRGDRVLRLPSPREAPAVLLAQPRRRGAGQTPPPAPAVPRPGAGAGGPPDGGAPPPASARPTPSGPGGGGGGLSE